MLCRLFVCVRRVCSMFCFCKQKTAYEMLISDWSSDVCSSDLDTQVEDRACARSTRDPDTAADPFDILAHYVKPDPAPGNRAYRLGCRKPGQIGRASWREQVCQYV